MSKKVAGTCYVKIDGTQLTLNGGIRTPPNTKTRETVVKGKFKETERIPYIDMTIVVDDETDLDTLSEATDMTCTAELANGKTYVLEGGYLVDEPELDSEEGTCDIRIEGSSGRYI